MENAKRLEEESLQKKGTLSGMTRMHKLPSQLKKEKEQL